MEKAELASTGDSESQGSRESTVGPAEPEPDEPASTASSDPYDPDQACRIDLSLLAEDCLPPLRGYVDRHLRRIAPLAGATGGQVTVAVVDDDRMAELHEQYRQTPGPTDVLTFDLHEGETDGRLEGDIVVCLDEAARQAGRRGHSVRDECLLYAVHGLLHLLGYDDHDRDEADAMHAREDELLAAVGVGPVYHRGERPS